MSLDLDGLMALRSWLLAVAKARAGGEVAEVVDAVLADMARRIMRGQPIERAYVRQRLKWRLIDAHRGRQPAVSLERAGSLPASAAAESDDVDSLLELLTPDQRRALELRRAGLRWSEVAAATGKTTSAVRKQGERSRERLRRSRQHGPRQPRPRLEERPWTACADVVLAISLYQGETHAQVGRRLGRTHRAVEGRRARLRARGLL